MHPIPDIRKNSDIGGGFIKTNEAEETLQKIKRKLNKLQVLVIPKEEEPLMVCLQHGSETIRSTLLIERRRVQVPVFYVGRPLHGRETYYTTTEKAILTPIHIARSLKTIFQKHKIKVVTKRPIQQMLKISGINGQLAKWAAKLRMYDVSYIVGKEAGGQVEGNRVPKAKETKKYKEEVMDAMASFHKLRITYLPKALSPKAEVLIGLATIKLEFLNQKVSVGVKTRPSVEGEDNCKGRDTTEKAVVRKPNFIWENSGSN
ncbi:reverse transcriptase domain-containing protein [Tanacetum coccineum]